MKTKTLIFLISLLYITLAKAQYGIEPTAVAGADQNLTDNDGNGSESAFLDGSSSLDADGTIVSYLWTEGTNQLSTSDTVTLDFTVGTHTVVLTVEDNDGLTGVDTVIITVNAGSGSGMAPTAVAGIDQILTDNDGDGSESAFLDGSSSLDADGTIVSYLWTEGTNQLSTSDTVTLDFTVGTHTVVLTVEDNDGLTGVDTVIITVNAVTNTINIQNNNLISIYPNPFNNYINIENNNVKIIELSIIDINGKVILQSKNCNKLNTEKLRAGIYFCKIKTSNTIIVNKLIKQ